MNKDLAKNRDIAVKVSSVKKMYKLGQIGGGTLQRDLQSWWARVRGKEDPNIKIGEEQRSSGDTFMALNGVDMTIYQGEAVGIIGRNGAGKSTLLKLLSRVTAPTEGDIDIYGRIASMLEVGTGFNGELTGRENVYMNGAILGMTKAEIDAKMEDIIEFSEVREFIDTPVKRYSSGMFVKLAFSVAAHLDAEIMIMDEVLAVGDMAFQTKCLDKMREAANKDGRTVLYVSHNMNTIRQLCDRCIVLDKGQVIFEGDVEKAISVYYGHDDTILNHYVYDGKQRNSAQSNEDFVIKEFTARADKLSFLYGSKFDFELKIYSKYVQKDVALRFEVKTSGGVIIGSMHSDRKFDFEAGETKVITATMDLDHFVSGNYMVDIVAFMHDRFGIDKFMDGVYPGFKFEISDQLTESNKLVWLHQYWGNVQLHEVITTE